MVDELYIYMWLIFSSLNYSDFSSCTACSYILVLSCIIDVIGLKTLVLFYFWHSKIRVLAMVIWQFKNFWNWEIGYVTVFSYRIGRFCNSISVSSLLSPYYMQKVLLVKNLGTSCSVSDYCLLIKTKTNHRVGLLDQLAYLKIIIFFEYFGVVHLFFFESESGIFLNFK